MVVEIVNISLLRIKIMSMLIVVYSYIFIKKKKKKNSFLIASFLLVFLTKYCALHCKIVLGILHQNVSWSVDHFSCI